MPLVIDVAIAKTNKYASRESGDTVEIVERPGGGLSVIMADGQGSGRAAKTVSMLVTAKVASLLKEGVRDGAAARVANDFLFALRHGQVSATLDILSVDLKTGTVVITRNSQTVGVIIDGTGPQIIRGTERPLGVHSWTRPCATEIPAVAGLRVILVSDGVAHAGTRSGQSPLALSELTAQGPKDVSASEMSDRILDEAIRRDRGKPADDMSVVTLALGSHQETTLVRRMRAKVPLP